MRLAAAALASSLFATGLACSSGGNSGTAGSGGSAGTSGGAGGTSGGGASRGSGGSSGTTSWTGLATGDPLQVTVQIAIRMLTPPSTYAVVGVFNPVTNSQPDGATVTLTPFGQSPIVLGGGGGIPYQKGFELGWVASYELSITHTSGSRTGITLTPPSAHTVALDPPPKVDTPTLVTWTPSGEPDVSVHVLLGKYGTPSASPLPDSGSFMVPATAFPAPGGNSVILEVQRSRRDVLPPELSVQTIVSAYESQIVVQP